jgi:hypothetical protein
MIKHFCDICGAPANDRVVTLSHPFGSGYRAYKTDRGDSFFQPKCNVWVRFEAADHPKVSDRDSLDLCSPCQTQLLQRLICQLSVEHNEKTKDSAAP